jgi:hypothetical protein
VVPEQQENCWLVDSKHNNNGTMNHPLKNSILDMGTAFLLGKDLSMLDKDDDTITTTLDSSFMEWSHSSQPGGCQWWTKPIFSAMMDA